jgi:hypothetical protein
MAFNLVEAEGLQDVWDDFKEYKRDPVAIIFPNVDRTDESWNIYFDEYYCWRGSRIPQWFE